MRTCGTGWSIVLTLVPILESNLLRLLKIPDKIIFKTIATVALKQFFCIFIKTILISLTIVRFMPNKLINASRRLH